MKLFTPRHPSLIARRLALIGLLIPCSAYSITLGELELQSYVGQPFRAAVAYRLNAGENLSADCIRLTLPSSELPSLSGASIGISRHNDSSGTLLISSTQNVGEPIVGFGIQVACASQQLSRSFTAFLNIAPASEPKPAPVLALPPKSSRPSTSAANLPSRDPETLTIKKPTTLAELAKKYYPADTPQYPRYLNKLISVNAGYTAETPLATGSEIIIPELLRSSKKSAPKVAKAESGLLRLDGMPLTPPAKPVTPSDAEYARQLEQKIIELNELQLKMQLEIAQLNLRLATMNQASRVAASIAMPASNAASAVPSSPAQRAPEPDAGNANPTTAADTSPLLWAGIIAGVLALFGGLAFIKRRRDQRNWRRAQLTEHDLSQFGPNTTLQAPAGFLSQNTLMSLLHVGHAPHGIEVEEESLADDMARAQILIAQGETMDAIDVLYRCIDEDPEDIERWLMLFRLFRQQGMKTEYAHLAQNLKLIQHDEADWELVRNIGAKLDPENPLYFREPAPKAAPQHTANYAQAFNIELPEPAKPKLDLDLDAPLSPDLSMMLSMAQEREPATRDTIETNFDIEELNLNDIENTDESHTLEFDIERLDSGKKST